MKKASIVLTMLLLSGLAKAGVWVGCRACEDGTGPPYDVTISYDLVDVVELIRAFALDVTVDSELITGYSNPNPHYDIYPGSIVIDASGNVIDPGTPIADPTYPGTLGGLGTSGVTLEMGSLYQQGEPPPPSMGELITLTVSEPCWMEIAENTIRGGIVLENPAIPANPTLQGCEVPEPCSLCLLGIASLALLCKKP
jgi:hypothetical protein